MSIEFEKPTSGRYDFGSSEVEIVKTMLREIAGTIGTAKDIDTHTVYPAGTFVDCGQSQLMVLATVLELIKSAMCSIDRDVVLIYLQKFYDAVKTIKCGNGKALEFKKSMVRAYNDFVEGISDDYTANACGEYDDLLKLFVGLDGRVLELWAAMTTHVEQVLNRHPINIVDDTASRFRIPVLEPVNMWVMPGGYFTVEWTDGSKTTVHSDNPDANEFTAFCICVAKKMFGSTTNVERAMSQAIDQPKRKYRARKAAQASLKFHRKVEREQRKIEDEKRMEHMVQMELESLRAKKKASDIYAKECED